MTATPEQIPGNPIPGSTPAPAPFKSRKLLELISQNGPLIAASTVALMFCIIIGSLFWPFLSAPANGATLLRELSNFEVARGLITFLVAVTTVGIALILTVYVVVTADSTAAEKNSHLAKRY